MSLNRTLKIIIQSNGTIAKSAAKIKYIKQVFMGIVYISRIWIAYIHSCMYTYEYKTTAMQGYFR